MRVALIASLVSPLRAAEANGPHAVMLDLAQGLEARGHSATIGSRPGSRDDPSARAAQARNGAHD